jgi:hypothetical protein
VVVKEAEMARLTPRLRRLWERHGGLSPVMAEVRRKYSAFHNRPGADTLAALEEAVEKMEKRND